MNSHFRTFDRGTRSNAIRTRAMTRRICTAFPVGVQIVGRRLEEEKVLEGMKLIEGLLKRKAIAYTHMSI
jgi:Asp-tRNA(Asn)/Glu-tRNA(Gln) amidotransferase A subunit family amidase